MDYPIQPWPPIIRRPEAQRRLHRRLYQVVTFIAWTGWLYLFAPLATLLLWLAGLRAAWIESGLASDPLNVASMQTIAILALISALALVVWGEVDRRRYTAKLNRHVRQHGELRSVSEGMEIRLADVYRLRDARLALVNFTPDAKVLRVDGLDRPGPSRRDEMREMMQRLAETVNDSRSLEDLTRQLLELLEVATGFQSVYLTSIDEQNGTQYILFSRNRDRMMIPEGLAVPWQDTLCRRAMEENRFYTDDVPGVWPESDAARALGIQSYLSTPVKAGDALYGTLCAASAEAVPLKPGVEQLVNMFAKLIGLQVERDALIARLQKANLELSEVAMIDPLTGMANRRALIAELARMLSRVRREGGQVNVAFIDLDGFKAINDEHGHELGDAFLAAVAARIKTVLRDSDYAARYGGDEFVVLTTASDPEAVDRVRQRLSDAITGRYEIGSRVIRYAGASVGIASSERGEGSDALLARADEAMYAVKRGRREVETS